MAFVSIPDPSVSRPVKLRSGATEGEKRAVATGVVVAIVLLALYTLGVNSLKTFTIDQINIAMPMIVQLDSFLTAGWVVAFFYFWGELEKALRGSKEARLALRSKDPTRQFDTAQRASLHQTMQSREKELTPTFGLFAELVFGVVMFVISAIAAVFAVLTYTIISVQLSLEFMAGGLLVMIMTWIGLRYIAQRLREQTDAAMSEVGDLNHGLWRNQ